MKSKMLTRIVFGAIMIAVLAGLGSLEYWLDQQNAPYYESMKQAIKTGPSYMLEGLESPIPKHLPGLPTAIVIALVAILAFGELNKLATAAGTSLLTVTGLIWSVLISTEYYWRNCLYDLLHNCGTLFSILYTLLSIFFIFGLVALFLEQMIRYRTQDALRRIGATLLAYCYLGYLLGFIFTIRLYGIPFLVLFLAAVKCTDIGAYFTGSAIGKHKLIPWLSPGKSWEGLIGGLIFAAGVSVVICMYFPVIKTQMTIPQAILFGVLIGLIGQFGDLCESLLKRSANIKDAGSKVPEFGGVLDIIDSPLIAAPFAFLFFKFTYINV